MPHLLHPYKLVLGTSSGDPSPVINWDFLQSQSLTSFSRTSNATLFDSTGQLTYAPNNLLTYSQAFDNGAWTKNTSGRVTVVADQATAPDGTNTADKVTPNAIDGYHVIRQGGTTIASAYIMSVYYKPNGYTKIGLREDYSVGQAVSFDCTGEGSIINQTPGTSASITAVGNGWYRIAFKPTTAATNMGVGIYLLSQTFNSGNAITDFWIADGTSGGYLWGAQYEAVTYQTTPSTYVATTTDPYYGPRYPYAYNGTTWDAQGLLVEAAATNLIGYSEAFDDTAWSNSGLDTVSANSTIAPSGTATADTIKTTATNTIHDIYNTTGISFTSGVSYTHSVYLKKNTNDFAQLSLGSAAFGSNAWANFDLVNGVLGSVGSSATAAITSVGNGWYRCAITAAATSTASSFYVVDIANSTTMARQATWSSAGTESLYIWGAQLEAGDLPTSYIPNLSTGTTQRNADTSLAFSAISLPTGLSFSRASNAMQYDAAGRLTYAPNNLFLYSNTFSNGAWTKWATGSGVTPTVTGGQADPLGGTNGWRLQCSGVSASPDRSAIYQAATNSASANIVTIWAKSNTGASQTVAFLDYGGISGGAITVTTSWQQFSISATGANSGIIFGSLFNVSGTGGTIDVLIYAPTASLVTYETVPRPCDQLITTTDPKYGPRYDYDPLTRLPKGLLIEEGRTNVLSYSNTFATDWTDTNINRVSTTRTSPDGTGNALEVSASAGNATIIRNAAVGSSAARTLSIWVRRVSGTGDIQYTLDNGSNWTTQAITTTWARYSFAATTADQRVGFRIVTSGDAIQIYGAQLEAGSFPTSYIPNPGIPSGIRSADIATLTGTALTTLQGSASTSIVEYQTVGAGASSPRLIGSGPNGWTSLYMASDTGIGTYNGAASLTKNLGTSQTAVTRSASTGDASGRSITGNNLAVTSDTNAYRSVAVNSAYIGSDNGSGSFASMWTRKVGLWNVRLSDAKLQQKSVVGATL